MMNEMIGRTSTIKMMTMMEKSDSGSLFFDDSRARSLARAHASLTARPTRSHPPDSLDDHFFPHTPLRKIRESQRAGVVQQHQPAGHPAKSARPHIVVVIRDCGKTRELIVSVGKWSRGFSRSRLDG
jgi:hypothetical protein